MQSRQMMIAARILIVIMFLFPCAAARMSPPKPLAIATPSMAILPLRGGASSSLSKTSRRSSLDARSTSSQRTAVDADARAISFPSTRATTIFCCIGLAATLTTVYWDKIRGASPPIAVGSNSFRMALLALMVVQNSLTVTVGRYTRSNKKPKDLYAINHLVLTCEATKFFFSCILEYLHSNGNLWLSIKKHVFQCPSNFMKIVIPSLLYLVQNSLMYVALSNLSAPLFQVTYQTKLLTTALASVVMLQRRYSPKQWFSLTLLGFGVAVVVLGETTQKGRGKDKNNNNKSSALSAATEQHLSVGLVAVTISCLSSAAASVYLEKVLKKPAAATIAAAASGGADAPVSLWMWNMQMAFFSACIAMLQGMKLQGVDADKPFLHGFTGWVWLQVVLQAGGGMLVAAVMKYADNVLKGLATGVSVVMSTTLSHFLFGTQLTSQFTVGAGIILASVYFFSN